MSSLLRFLNTSEKNSVRLKPSSLSVLARLEMRFPMECRTPPLDCAGATADLPQGPDAPSIPVPHAKQNFAPSRLGLPQSMQNMSASLALLSASHLETRQISSSGVMVLWVTLCCPVLSR